MFTDDTKLKAATAALLTRPGYPTHALIEEIDRLFGQSRKVAAPPGYAHGVQDALRNLVNALAARLPEFAAR